MARWGAALPPKYIDAAAQYVVDLRNDPEDEQAYDNLFKLLDDRLQREGEKEPTVTTVMLALFSDKASGSSKSDSEEDSRSTEPDSEDASDSD